MAGSKEGSNCPLWRKALVVVAFMMAAQRIRKEFDRMAARYPYPR